MAKSDKDIFTEKVSLIYEYNSRSPLFVRQANTEIESNNLERAFDILTQGLKLFPNHPVAYVLLGKAFALKGKYPDAAQAFKKASTIIDSPQTFDYYIRELENIKKQRSPFTIKKRTTFIEEGSLPTKPSVSPLSAGHDDDLAQLAEKLTNARMNVSATDNEPEDETISTKEPAIVSETLGKIYATQGKFKEALQIYEILLQRNPGRKAELQKVIQELKIKIAGQS